MMPIGIPVIQNPPLVSAPAEYADYWILTNYQRHCLVSTNFWRMKEGKEAILIPPGEKEKIDSGYYLQPGFRSNAEISGAYLEPPSEILFPAQPRFSFFNPPITNTLPAKTITLAECARLIRCPQHYKENTEKLRAFTIAEERKRFKSKSLAYVCFSGIFSRRTEASLQMHSGLIVIDLDHINNPEEVKKDLSFDDNLYPIMIYISPSGDGLKVVIPIEIAEGTHADYFDAISNYLLHTHGMKADPSGRDVSRACFLCHDPKIFLHPNYNDWT